MTIDHDASCFADVNTFGGYERMCCESYSVCEFLEHMWEHLVKYGAASIQTHLLRRILEVYFNIILEFINKHNAMLLFRNQCLN